MPERQFKRRWFWLLLVFISALVIAAAVRFSVDHYTSEPPNYSQIEDGLWLGGKVVAPPPGTQAVLNLCEMEDDYSVLTHRWRPIRDAAPAPNQDWLKSQVDFIETERSAGHAVYVHCMNGVSRSGMVVVAYLMQRRHLSRDQSLELLRDRRPGVRPNPAFMELLLEWENSLKK